MKKCLAFGHAKINFNHPHPKPDFCGDQLKRLSSISIADHARALCDRARYEDSDCIVIYNEKLTCAVEHE